MFLYKTSVTRTLSIGCMTPFTKSFAGSTAMINSSNSTGRYLFTPDYASYHGILLLLPLVFGIVGLLGNTTILYIVWKRLYSDRKNSYSRRTFGRSYLFKYFVLSLAISDIMASITSSLILSLQLFYDVRQNIWVCRIVRFPFFMLPMVTIYNLVVISVERYCAIFHPFRIPRTSKIKMAVIFAWVGGIICAACITSMVEIQRFNLTDHNWTFACLVNSTKGMWRKALFIFISLFQYYIPNLALLYITFSIRRFLNKRRLSSIQTELHYVSSWWIGRFKGTTMFLKVFLAFSLPYLVFFGYNLIKSVSRTQLDYHSDYIVRYVSGFLALFNSSINPFIYSMNSPFFKIELRKMCQKICGFFKERPHKKGQVNDVIAVTKL